MLHFQVTDDESNQSATPVCDITKTEPGRKTPPESPLLSSLLMSRASVALPDHPPPKPVSVITCTLTISQRAFPMWVLKPGLCLINDYKYFRTYKVNKDTKLAMCNNVLTKYSVKLPSESELMFTHKCIMMSASEATQNHYTYQKISILL